MDGGWCMRAKLRMVEMVILRVLCKSFRVTFRVVHMFYMLLDNQLARFTFKDFQSPFIIFFNAYILCDSLTKILNNEWLLRKRTRYTQKSHSTWIEHIHCLRKWCQPSLVANFVLCVFWSLIGAFQHKKKDQKF